MKIFQTQAAQGDILIWRIAAIPDGVVERQPTNGHHIVAHSETGHHHTVAAAEARFYGSDDPMICYLVVDGEFADLVHHRSFDTHETLRIPAGTHEIRRQREYVPDGWRRVED